MQFEHLVTEDQLRALKASYLDAFFFLLHVVFQCVKYICDTYTYAFNTLNMVPFFPDLKAVLSFFFFFPRFFVFSETTKLQMRTDD